MNETPPSVPDTEERIRKLLHDLSTPATVITGFADLLERTGDTLTPERRAEYVGRIVEAARDLRHILDEQRLDGSA
jgi:signal transduction histidine kinase